MTLHCASRPATAIAAAIAILAAAPAVAGQITIGASLGTAYDLVSTGAGTIFADTPGFWATALFGADVGTIPPSEAHFGATTFTTGPQTNGVFSVVKGGAETLSVALPDGDLATGTAQITQIDDGSPNPHIAFTWNYTSSGDPAFLASFPGGEAHGDYTFDTVTTLLDDFVRTPGDEFVTGSAGQIPGTVPVPEPATLALLGAALLGTFGYTRARAR
jgi:hypothetical protein